MGHRRYLVLIALLAGAAVQAGPKDSPVVPPPMAQPQSVSIFRGHSIEVPLRAQGRHSRTVEISYPFLSLQRTPWRTPSHRTEVGGSDLHPRWHKRRKRFLHIRCSDLRQSGLRGCPNNNRHLRRASGTVGRESPLTSALWRWVRRAKSRLSCETAEEEILEGHMEVPPPWKIVGSTDYRLGRKQQRQVRILCAPTEQQDYFGKLVFSHDARVAVDLTVDAHSPPSN